MRVTSPWTPSYPDPVRARVGEALALSDRHDIWQGHRWIWAIAPDGREGWVPDDLVRDGIATRDYDATELACQTGDRLTVLDRTHGWVLCRAQDGRTGWVPEGNLAP